MKNYALWAGSETSRDAEMFVVQLDDAKELLLKRQTTELSPGHFLVSEDDLPFDLTRQPMADTPCQIEGTIQYWAN